MLIEQSPSGDGCVDTGAKILAEASIFHPFDTQLLSILVSDFLAKAKKILDSGEVMAPLACGSLFMVAKREESTRKAP